MGDEIINRNRRLSHDEVSTRAPRRFLIDVEETLRIVLEQEDTDRDFQVGRGWVQISCAVGSSYLGIVFIADLDLRLWSKAHLAWYRQLERVQIPRHPRECRRGD
jgi:hypothetical protein